MRLPPDAKAMIEKHASRGAAIDSNLLLLLILGQVEPKQVGRHKRTTNYQADDLDLLLYVVKMFQKIILTPHVLTQADDLLGARNPKNRFEQRLVSAFIQGVGLAHVERDPAQELVQDTAFPRFGLADVGLYRIACRGTLVLTDDRRLADHLVSLGRDAINFAHLRSLYLVQ